MKRKNIVLIGLTGCGKSTIGKALSYKLRMSFVDMDTYIERKEGMTISEIFAQKGESYFRQAETAACKALSKNWGQIIATGGGVVENPENMRFLKQHAVIVFLDRTPEMILQKINLKKRPLLSDNGAYLFVLDRRRRPLYESYADVTVSGGTKISRTLSDVLLALHPHLPEQLP